MWVRDGGRCALVATNGRRCTERVFLEFHHREPYVLGGEATVANVSLRCRAHNVYEAELAFGPRVPASCPCRRCPWSGEHLCRLWVGSSARRPVTGREKREPAPESTMKHDSPDQIHTIRAIKLDQH